MPSEHEREFCFGQGVDEHATFFHPPPTRKYPRLFVRQPVATNPLLQYWPPTHGLHRARSPSSVGRDWELRNQLEPEAGFLHLPPQLMTVWEESEKYSQDYRYFFFVNLTGRIMESPHSEVSPPRLNFPSLCLISMLVWPFRQSIAGEQTIPCQ